jgi:transcription initiation factor IIE alpha subunit
LLRTRILLWAREEVELKKLAPKAIQILETILYRGEIARGEIAEILNTSDRHARRLISPLLEQDILVSNSPKSALKLAFPARLISRWMPGLFP